MKLTKHITFEEHEISAGKADKHIKQSLEGCEIISITVVPFKRESRPGRPEETAFLFSILYEHKENESMGGPA